MLLSPSTLRFLRPILLPLLLHLLLLLLPHRTVADFSPTHVVDCIDRKSPLPPISQRVGFIAQQFGETAYTFCHAPFGLGFSLGCICNMTNEVECTEQEAFGGTRMLAIPELRQFCMDSCWCVKKEDSPWEDAEEEGWRQHRLRQQAEDRHRNWVASRRGKPFRGGHRQSGGGRSSSSTGSSSQHSLSLWEYSSTPKQLQSQCGATCSSMQECGDRGPGCKCKSNVVPNTRSWTSFCGMDWDSPLGKRELDASACPCNSTYVSKGCCESVDGIVWEAPNLNLGTVAEDESWEQET
jgi:hypothetical protein